MRYLWFIFPLILLGCSDNGAREAAWIHAEAEKKLDAYRKDKEKECLKVLIEEVLEDADSIIRVEAHLDIPDSLVVPTKRSRPSAPNVAFPDFNSPTNPVKGDSIKGQ